MNSTSNSVTTTYSILLVTAEHSRANDLLTRLRAHFEKLPFSIDLAEDGSRALYLLTKKTYFLVIADADLPIMDGLSLVREIRRDDGSLSVFILANKTSQTDEPGVELMALPIPNWTDFLTKVEWQLPEDARVRYGLKKQDQALAKLIANYVSTQIQVSDSMPQWQSNKPIALGLNRSHVKNESLSTNLPIVEQHVATPTDERLIPSLDHRDLVVSLVIVAISAGLFVGLSFVDQNAFVAAVRYLALFLGGFALFGYFMARVFERISKTLLKSRSS